MVFDGPEKKTAREKSRRFDFYSVLLYICVGMREIRRITRDRLLTPEEAAKYKKIREQVEQELPELIARHHEYMKNRMNNKHLIITATIDIELGNGWTDEQIQQAISDIKKMTSFGDLQQSSIIEGSDSISADAKISVPPRDVEHGHCCKFHKVCKVGPPESCPVVQGIQDPITPCFGHCITYEKDVHTEHCCAEHGRCEYGEEDVCPVVQKRKPASFPCNCEW